jgi:tetratricopeptide (TPR) repeat protein
VTGWDKADLAEIAAIPGPGTLQWTPVRRHFDIAAFGINAFVATEAGQDVVERHTETVRHHEEVYVVVSGSATFTLGGEETDASAGTIIFVRDPAVERSAVAREPGTTVLAIGGKPGTPYAPGPWEPVYAARSLGESGDYEGAIAELKRGLELHAQHKMLLYRLAGWEALAGRRGDALEHLARAVAQSEPLRAQAHIDEEFSSIRDDPRFPAPR